MGWYSDRGKCNNCGYCGAMFSTGCPACNSKDLNGSYDYAYDDLLFIAIIIIVIVISLLGG